MAKSNAGYNGRAGYFRRPENLRGLLAQGGLPYKATTPCPAMAMLVISIVDNVDMDWLLTVPVGSHPGKVCKTSGKHNACENNRNGEQGEHGWDNRRENGRVNRKENGRGNRIENGKINGIHEQDNNSIVSAKNVAANIGAAIGTDISEVVSVKCNTADSAIAHVSTAESITTTIAAKSISTPSTVNYHDMKRSDTNAMDLDFRLSWSTPEEHLQAFHFDTITTDTASFSSANRSEISINSNDAVEFACNNPTAAYPSPVEEIVPWAPDYLPYNFVVVDDNEINLRIFSRMLAKLYPCANVCTVQDLATVDTSDVALQHIDILFLDIEMPEVSGPEIAARVRRLSVLDHVGLIAVTTRCLFADLELYRRTGFDFTFPKPVDTNYAYVMAQVARVLQKRIDMTR